MNRLGYGIYPIASRRHQPRETFQKFPHQYERWESITILTSWILTPILAATLPGITGQWDFFNWFVALIFMDILILWAVKTDA